MPRIAAGAGARDGQRVERDGDVRDVVALQEGEHRVQVAPHRAHLAARCARVPRRAVEAAEQLERAVDDVGLVRS